MRGLDDMDAKRRLLAAETPPTTCHKPHALRIPTGWHESDYGNGHHTF